MPDRNRRFFLRERPFGRIGPDTFELTEEAVPDIGGGEALVRVDWISLDPTNRAWLNDTPTYLPPVGIGEVMRGLGLGEVVASNNPNYAVGQTVQGLVGWQEYVVTSDAMPLLPVDVAEGVSPSAYLGALGMTGLTAWIGIRDIGKPQPGETVVVSAAAGAVGSVAGQLAKSDGARVVGIAGGPEKCALLTDRLGFDAAVDHRADDWAAQLAAATPDGIEDARGNLEGALAAYTRALDIAELLAAADPDNTGYQGNLATSLVGVGDMRAARGDTQGALAAYTRALEINERLAAAEPDNPVYQRDVVHSLNRVGEMRAVGGDPQGALQSYTRALDIAERMAAADPNNPEYQRYVSASAYNLGSCSNRSATRPPSSIGRKLTRCLWR